MQSLRVISARARCNCRFCSDLRRSLRRHQISYSLRYCPYSQSGRTLRYVSTTTIRQSVQIQEGNFAMGAHEGIQVVPQQPPAIQQYQSQENNPPPNFQFGNNLNDFYRIGNPRYQPIPNENISYLFYAGHQYYNGSQRIPAYIAFGNPAFPASMVIYRPTNESIFNLQAL